MKLYVAGWDLAGPVRIGTADDPAGAVSRMRPGSPHDLRVLAVAIRPLGSGPRWSAPALVMRAAGRLQAKRMRGMWYGASLAEVVAILGDDVRWVQGWGKDES